jgi:hypothetical protein
LAARSKYSLKISSTIRLTGTPRLRASSAAAAITDARTAAVRVNRLSATCLAIVHLRNRELFVTCAACDRFPAPNRSFGKYPLPKPHIVSPTAQIPLPKPKAAISPQGCQQKCQHMSALSLFALKFVNLVKMTPLF